MLVKQHWSAGWRIRLRGTISAVRLELWRANFRRFVVDYRRQYAVRVCAARDRDVAGHDLGHKSPFTTRINADGEAALGIPHWKARQPSVEGGLEGCHEPATSIELGCASRTPAVCGGYHGPLSGGVRLARCCQITPRGCLPGFFQRLAAVIDPFVRAPDLEWPIAVCPVELLQQQPKH